MEAKSVTVRFLTNFAIAVSDKEPDDNAIRTALSSILPIAVSSGKATPVVNGITIFGDIADAAREILKVNNNSNVLPFIVPVQTKAGCTYNVKANVKGTSLTTDSGKENEKANVKTSVKFGSNESKVEPSLNEGLEDTKDVFLMPALANIRSQGGEIDSRVQVTSILKTNGGILSATISAVNIEFVELIIDEICGQDQKPDNGGGGKLPGDGNNPNGNNGDGNGSGANNGGGQGIKNAGIKKIEGVGAKYASIIEQATGAKTVADVARLETSDLAAINIPAVRLASIVGSAKVAMDLDALGINADFQDVEVIQKVYGSVSAARETRDDASTLAAKIVDAGVRVPESYEPQRLLDSLG
jgi:hypothetical protein